MSVLGPNGQPVSSKDITYEVGGVLFDSSDTPESILPKAIVNAQQIVGQQIYQMVLEKTQNEVIAQLKAQEAASKINNPFHFEPCALGIFMLMAREIEHRDRVIAALAKRLDALDHQDSTDTLKKSWIKTKTSSDGKDQETSKDTSDSN